MCDSWRLLMEHKLDDMIFIAQREVSKARSAVVENVCSIMYLLY